jgi:putative membrane protein
MPARLRRKHRRSERRVRQAGRNRNQIPTRAFDCGECEGFGGPRPEGREAAIVNVPYCGPAPSPDLVHAAWNLDPVLLAALAAGAWLLRGAGRPAQLGLVLLFVAFVSPICALSAGLFSARSVHHLLIVFGAAPLLAGSLIGKGGPAWTDRLPLSGLFLLHTLVFWAWHVPSFYQWALSSDAAYWIGQIALLGSAVLFWTALLRSSAPTPAAFFALLAMVMQMGLLGALITFAPAALYEPHFATTAPYGLTPLEDQQLAGLIMWVASLPLTVAAGWLVLGRWFRRLGGEAAT